MPKAKKKPSPGPRLIASLTDLRDRLKAAKKPTRKAAPKRLYRTEAFDERGSYLIYMGRHLWWAKKSAEGYADFRITIYERTPAKKRGKR